PVEPDAPTAEAELGTAEAELGTAEAAGAMAGTERPTDPGVAASEESDPATEASEAAAAPDPPRREARAGRRPRRGPPATAAGTGRVIVSTPGGWANVYDANGRFLGDTPLTMTLPAGRHRLSLRFFGNPPARWVTVEVTAGGTHRVSETPP